MNSKARILAVDLDGSLIRTDLLYESLMLLIKKNIFYVFYLPFWLLKGKVAFKHEIVSRIDLDASLLPYNQGVIDVVRAAKAKGQSCYLVTGSMTELAQQVADHLGIFDGVFASSLGSENLTGRHKAEFLVNQFGERGFDYVGNDTVDLAVWQKSHKAIVVCSDEGLFNKAKAQSLEAEWIKTKPLTLNVLLKTIRIHQWVKNSLIAVPLLTSHQALHVDLVLLCVMGFLSFSLAASSVYVLNDLLDLFSDRQHPTKRERPFASGAMTIKKGSLLFPILLGTSLLICLVLPLHFFYALVVYYAITVLYSFKLKQVLLLDTITLAALYTMRIIAGTLLIGVPFSYWLLAFSMFIFLSLALIKRYVELIKLTSSDKQKTIGRGYHVNDASMIAPLGGAAGYIAVLVLALYINSSQVVALYQHASVLWLACVVLLYWISRAWLLAHRGEMDDDPIFFAIKDKVSLLCAGLIFMVFVFAV